MGDTSHGKKFKIRRRITYILDRGFRDYQLYTKIIKEKAFLIAGLHKTTAYQVLENIDKTEDDVLSDEIVILGNSKDDYEIKKYPIRIIKFWDDGMIKEKNKYGWRQTDLI